jgi:ketosteroid isomerase-like protein/quercetin dioxygenase-like cupin family protein
MRRFISLVVVGVISSSCAQTVNVEQEKSALMARDAEWAKTPNDIDKWAAYLAPDATFATSGAPEMKGAQAIKSGLGPMMKAPGFRVMWTATSADVAASGDVGHTSGNYEIAVNNAGGKPSVEKGTYLTTWKKINGSWLVTHDIASPNMPIAMASPPVVAPVATIKWMDAPPFLPKGAKLAVLVGDPSKTEPFTVRLQMPDGYKIPPHTHPNDEHVTVMSGTFRAAMGEKWDDKALGDFAPGSYANMAAGMAHYAVAKGATVVQVHGTGPFIVNYVNPADDPSKQR